MNQDDRLPLTAEDAVLDALLEHVHRPDTEARERRVHRALGATVHAPRARHRAPFRSWRSRHWTELAVATLLFALVFHWLGEGSPTALGVVERSAEAMRGLIDRTYSVTIELADMEPPSLEGELTLRGNSRLAIRLSLPSGDLWMGEGKDHAWVVPPNRLLPVFLRKSGSTFGDYLPGADGTRLPSMEIATMLERLHDNYDLGKPISTDGRTTVRAVLRAGVVKPDTPAMVEFESEPDGTVRRLHLRWNEPRPLQPIEVQLVWTGSPTIADEFYEHTTHHDGRIVIDRR